MIHLAKKLQILIMLLAHPVFEVLKWVDQLVFLQH